MYGKRWFFFCFFDVLNNVVDGYGEFTDTGVSFDAVVMPFDYVCKNGDAEVVCFLFYTAGVGHLCKEVVTHLCEPMLRIGKKEEEFDKFVFVHGCND